MNDLANVRSKSRAPGTRRLSRLPGPYTDESGLFLWQRDASNNVHGNSSSSEPVRPYLKKNNRPEFLRATGRRTHYRSFGTGLVIPPSAPSRVIYIILSYRTRDIILRYYCNIITTLMVGRTYSNNNNNNNNNAYNRHDVAFDPGENYPRVRRTQCCFVTRTRWCIPRYKSVCRRGNDASVGWKTDAIST